jgi:hypothetical protein
MRELNPVLRTAVAATQYLNAIGVARALQLGGDEPNRTRFVR